MKVHKEALSLQVELWRLLLRPRLRVGELDEAMEALDVAAAQALQVYKRCAEGPRGLELKQRERERDTERDTERERERERVGTSIRFSSVSNPPSHV